MQQGKRNWSMYNAAQTTEKTLAFSILNDAVDMLDMPSVPDCQRGRGRPQIGMDDMLKCCVIKVFNGFSSRRTIPDLEMCKAQGYIRRVPHFNSICNYMKSREMSRYIHILYSMVSAPLKEVEDTFASDATGFGTFNSVWKDAKYGVISKEGSYCYNKITKTRDFIKLHATCGVNTCVITSARVTLGKAGDNPQFRDMIMETSKTFNMKAVCADGAYLSKDNCKIVYGLGARPFIKPKRGVRTMGHHLHYGSSSAWNKMLRFWTDNRGIFEEHYHKRSNIESAFSAVKRKFLPYVRSKCQDAQFNELLCKVACHNLSVLVTAIFELGLAADYRKYMKGFVYENS